MAKTVREPLSTIYAQAKLHRTGLIAAAMAAIFLMLLGVELKAIVLVPLLFIIAVFSTFYKRLVRVPPAIELLSLTTVLVGIAYGPWVGAIYGAIAALTAEILNSGIDAFIIGYIGGRAVMGALAGFFTAWFPGMGIVATGMVLTLLFNLIAQSLYLTQGDPEAKAKTALYVSLNLFSNWLIFTVLGQPLLALLI